MRYEFLENLVAEIDVCVHVDILCFFPFFYCYLFNVLCVLGVREKKKKKKKNNFLSVVSSLKYIRSKFVEV